jgi:hypothetical protein
VARADALAVVAMVIVRARVAVIARCTGIPGPAKTILSGVAHEALIVWLRRVSRPAGAINETLVGFAGVDALAPVADLCLGTRAAPGSGRLLRRTKFTRIVDVAGSGLDALSYDLTTLAPSCLRSRVGCAGVGSPRIGKSRVIGAQEGLATAE